MELIAAPQIHRFTRENAREMAERSAEARRKQRDERNRMLASIPANASEERRQERILRQLDQIDGLIENCSQANELHKLVASKDTLYHMLFPRRGSLKPRPERRNQAPTIDSDSGHVQPQVSDIMT